MSSRFNEINWVINCAIAVITMMFGLALIFSLSYHNRDLREQEEVYTTEIKRLIGKCKDNKISIQAPEHKPSGRF